MRCAVQVLLLTYYIQQPIVEVSCYYHQNSTQIVIRILLKQMTTKFFEIAYRFMLTLFIFTKVDDRQLMKEFLPEFRPELLEAADFNLYYMFPHRLIHTHMPGRRVSKSDLICFPSFITQIRPIMTLKSNNLSSKAIISLSYPFVFHA